MGHTLARVLAVGLCVNDEGGLNAAAGGTWMALPDILRDKLRLPVVGAPLFIISHPALVIAQCRAGIVGSFPALNARPISQLDEWLHEITEALAAHDRAHPERPAAPFAVNQIVHKSNARLEEDMAMTVKWKAPLVITSLGAREDVNEAVHGYGGLTLHDIINNRFAHKAIEKGADGLIAVAAGAGGHAGSTSPFALIQDIRAWFDGPLLLSGAIATGLQTVTGLMPDAVDTGAALKIPVASGDRVILYTDGFTESFNKGDDMLGVEGLAEIVRETSKLPLNAMTQEIVNRVAAYRHGPAADDMSLVAVEIP